MGTTPSVAIGVIPRERFNVAAEAVRRIVKHTSVPYRLVIIDCNMPERYRSEVEHALPASAPVDVLRFDRYLLPNESRNHVVAAGPGDLPHLHAHVVKKFLGASNRACHPACKFVAA